MKYGKVISGRLEVAPVKIKAGGRLIISPRAADYMAAGYYPIDTTNAPPEGYRWESQWEVSDGVIRRKYVEIPQEEQEYMDNSRIIVVTPDEAELYDNVRDIAGKIEEVFG